MQTLTSIKLALAPVIAGAALIYAALGNVRRAILALAALEITTRLLEDVWSIPIHGLELSPTTAACSHSSITSYFRPPRSLARHPLSRTGVPLAGLLVSVPTIVN